MTRGWEGGGKPRPYTEKAFPAGAGLAPALPFALVLATPGLEILVSWIPAFQGRVPMLFSACSQVTTYDYRV